MMIDMNLFLGIYVGLYLLTAVGELGLDFLNTRHLAATSNDVPEPLASDLDENQLARSNAYTRDTTLVGILKQAAGHILFLAIILYGVMPWFARIVEGLPYPVAGLLFFALPLLLAMVLDLPFGYYSQFVLEERYGFNTATLRTWLLDVIKGSLLALVIGGVLLFLVLVIARYGGGLWWLWTWAVYFAFQVLMTILYPTVIAPIFNTFTPLDNVQLKEKVLTLATAQGVTLDGIFQMDATRRSRHTNAYFSGLGRTKRIVLYDTLLESHDDEEILAVLAHELGHLKGRHILIQACLMGVATFILFYLASEMMTWTVLYRSFGFTVEPLYAGLFLVGVLWAPLGFFLGPVAMALARRFERDADRHAAGVLGRTDALIRTLVKMARDNLSNLTPHPLYVFFNYSHPPLGERIESLRRFQKEKGDLGKGRNGLTSRKSTLN